MKLWVNDLGDFIARHWGDVVGLGLLCGGCALVVFHARMTGDWGEVKTLGSALALAAMGILKLRNVPKNGPPER